MTIRPWDSIKKSIVFANIESDALEEIRKFTNPDGKISIHSIDYISLRTGIQHAFILDKAKELKLI